MTQTTTLTQKGQVTLPKKFRDAIGIKPYKKVNIELKGDYIKIFSTEDILDLAGTFKPKSTVPIGEVRKKMETDYNRT